MTTPSTTQPDVTPDASEAKTETPRSDVILKATAAIYGVKEEDLPQGLSVALKIFERDLTSALARCELLEKERDEARAERDMEITVSDKWSKQWKAERDTLRAQLLRANESVKGLREDMEKIRTITFGNVGPEAMQAALVQIRNNVDAALSQSALGEDKLG